MTGRSSPLLPLLPLLALPTMLALLLASGCRSTGSEPASEPAPAPIEPASVWLYVADAPVVAVFDLARLRADRRVAAVWDAAGPTDQPDDAMQRSLDSADTLAVAYFDAIFEQRLNVVVGGTEPARLVAELDDGSAAFQPYTVGAHQLWTSADHPWAVATPETGVLLTGAPEAVRRSLAGRDGGTPSSAPGPVVTIDVRVTDDHRRVARIAARSPALSAALDSVATARGELNLGLGADIALRFKLVEGASPDSVVAIIAAALVEARAWLGDARSAPRFASLVDLARVEVVDGGEVVVYWEIDREAVDALAAALVTASETP